MGNNDTDFSVDDYIEKLRNLSDRGKREVCNLIGLLTFYEERTGEMDEEDK